MKYKKSRGNLLIAGVLGLIILFGGWKLFNRSNQPTSSAFTEINQEYETLRSRTDLKTATFAGGCFWCMEGPFESIDGVVEVVSGFSGGSVDRPTYKQVVNGGTGHRESVHIFYDPTKVTYDMLLERYWKQVDPTDSGGQFADRGYHYTTAIFYHDTEQKNAAEAQIAHLNTSGMYEKPIVTQVLPFTSFYPAEDYHQDFYQKSSEYYKKYKKGSGREEYIEAMEKKFENQ